jgi:hypothetical protein
MKRTPNTILALAALAAAFALMLVIPIPSLPDTGRAVVEERVEERLPGWEVQRLDPSWEGGYTVVASCAGLQLDFQYVPGHGLPADDAWLHPSNAHARERLDTLSDHRRYLLWRAQPERAERLSCAEELARSGIDPTSVRPFD